MKCVSFHQQEVKISQIYVKKKYIFRIKVTSNQPGYIVGDIQFRFRCTAMSVCIDENSGWTNAMPNEHNACALPISSSWSDLSKDVEIQSNAKFILVIEKEGVFRRLVNCFYNQSRFIFRFLIFYPSDFVKINFSGDIHCMFIFNLFYNSLLCTCWM